MNLKGMRNQIAARNPYKMSRIKIRGKSGKAEVLV
jgi:hypothetical protein